MNKLKINSMGNIYPSRSFDLRESYISPQATNLNSNPMFYVGNRVNTLWSSTNPLSLAIMKFGDNNSHKVYGNLTNAPGQIKAKPFTNFNYTIDKKGNYKLIDTNGVSRKIYSNRFGYYIKKNNKMLYI